MSSIVLPLSQVIHSQHKKLKETSDVTRHYPSLLSLMQKQADFKNCQGNNPSLGLHPEPNPDKLCLGCCGSPPTPPDSASSLDTHKSFIKEPYMSKPPSSTSSMNSCFSTFSSTQEQNDFDNSHDPIASLSKRVLSSMDFKSLYNSADQGIYPESHIKIPISLFIGFAWTPPKHLFNRVSLNSFFSQDELTKTLSMCFFSSYENTEDYADSQELQSHTIEHSNLLEKLRDELIKLKEKLGTIESSWTAQLVILGMTSKQLLESIANDALNSQRQHKDEREEMDGQQNVNRHTMIEQQVKVEEALGPKKDSLEELLDELYILRIAHSSLQKEHDTLRHKNFQNESNLKKLKLELLEALTQRKNLQEQLALEKQQHKLTLREMRKQNNSVKHWKQQSSGIECVPHDVCKEKSIQCECSQFEQKKLEKHDSQITGQATMTHTELEQLRTALHIEKKLRQDICLNLERKEQHIRRLQNQLNIANETVSTQVKELEQLRKAKLDTRQMNLLELQLKQEIDLRQKAEEKTRYISDTFHDEKQKTLDYFQCKIERLEQDFQMQNKCFQQGFDCREKQQNLLHQITQMQEEIDNHKRNCKALVKDKVILSNLLFRSAKVLEQRDNELQALLKEMEEIRNTYKNRFNYLEAPMKSLASS